MIIRPLYLYYFSMSHCSSVLSYCMLWCCFLESSCMWLGLIIDDGKLDFCDAILFWHIDSDIWNHVIYFVYFEMALATLRVGDLSCCYEVETTVVIYMLAYLMIVVFRSWYIWWQTFVDLDWYIVLFKKIDNELTIFTI